MRGTVNLRLSDVKLVMERLRQVRVPAVHLVKNRRLKVTLWLLIFSKGVSHCIQEETIDHVFFLGLLLLYNAIFYLFHNIFTFLVPLSLETSKVGANKLLASG